MRRFSYLLVGLALWALAGGGGGGELGAPTGPERVTLLLEWFPNPDHVALYVAKEAGFFAEEGINVEFQVPTDPNLPPRAVALGQADFAVNYAPNVVIARAQGVPIVSVAALIPNTLAGVMFLRGSGIEGPQDLKGKTIGVSVTPLYEVLLAVLAGAGGLKPGDWETVFVGFNLVPALLSGQVDAISGAFRNFEPVVAELAGREAGVLPFEAYGVPRYDELVLITRDELLRKTPDKARRFLRAVARGIAFTLERPAEALKFFFRANPDLDDELNRRAFRETLPYLGSPWQLPTRWARLAEFLYEQGLIERAVDANELFTNEFLPLAVGE